MNVKKFGVGDLVTDGKFKMKVMACVYDYDEHEWYYTCDAVDFRAPYLREIPQSKLELADL